MRTMPLLHSNVACLRDRHCSGNSFVWSLRHSEGKRPCLTTQSDAKRQSFSACMSGSQYIDMVRATSADEMMVRTKAGRPSSGRSAKSVLWGVTIMLPAAVRSLLRTTPTVAPVPHRALLSITGPQASEFLSGIVAATPPPSPDCHFYTAFLHAQARRLRALHAHFI